MSGRVLFTVAVLVVFVAAIVYTALCARAEARHAALVGDDVRPVVTDAAIARLLDDAAEAQAAA